MAQCTATSKRTGNRCRRFCEPGKTVCKWHGGKSTGPPKGSKNALTTGAYEKIFPGCMSEDELLRMETMNTEPLAVIEEEIRLTRIREQRILQRISKARDAEALAGQPKEGGGKHPAMVVTGGQETQHKNEGTAAHSAMTVAHEAHSALALRLERALSEVQSLLLRLIDQKTRIIAEQPDGGKEKGQSGVLKVPGIYSPAEWAAAAAQSAKV